MKKVVLFGAAGHTGKYITRKMQQQADVQLTAFVRDPSKFGDMNLDGVTICQGDALNAADVKAAMMGQDAMLCSLEGDVLAMARNIVAALGETGVKRIIWITGMGIHHEITGPRGDMLSEYAKQRPEYIQAADLIAASPAVTTLLRCPGIMDADNENSALTPEGVQPAMRDVDRAAIAQAMADMLADDALGSNDSLAITNA